MAKSKGKFNPFFRDGESEFVEKSGIRSPISSSFGHPTRGSNVMEDELSRVDKASRGTTFGKGKK